MLQSQIISKQLLPRRFLGKVSSSKKSNFAFPSRYSTTAAIHRPAASAVAVAVVRNNSEKHTTPSSRYLRDRDIDRYLKDSMSQFLPHAVVRTTSQLDLELGEDDEHSGGGAMALGASWEDNLWKVEEDDDDGLIEEEVFVHTVAPAREAATPEPTTVVQPKPRHRLQHNNKQKSAMELLATFDPQNPPNISDFDSREVALESIQLWLECEAQQEAVSRYQKVIEDARTRNDFSSLSMVQRQIVQWYGPLKEAIEKRQKEFMQGTTVPSGKKFGPFLCTLPAAKLAVIVAHEAVIHSALAGIGTNRHPAVLGVTLTSMAARIGQAVEDELVVHRFLHKRAQDAQQDMKARTAATGFEADVSSVFASQREEPSLFDASNSSVEIDGFDVSVHNNTTHKWSYASSHLKNYLDEISQYQPSAKKRNVTKYAIKRARQVLERDEEWKNSEKVQLGAAMLQILLETATIEDDGRNEMAFTLEKKWVADCKMQSFIAMNDRLYKMIVKDKLESLAATTTRHKPMVVPPKLWTATKDGGYLMLKVDLMRYHGCHTQREAMRNAESSTIFDGLNVLGRVKWRINTRLLEVAQRCWQEDIPLGDIPSRTDLDIPDEPEPPIRPEKKWEKGTEEYDLGVAEYRKYRERLNKYNRARQKNMVRNNMYIVSQYRPRRAIAHLLPLIPRDTGFTISAMLRCPEAGSSRKV